MVKATAIAHPIQGLIKYHGLADERLRLPFHDSISVCTAPLTTRTTIEFGDFPRDDASVDGRPLSGHEMARVLAVVDVTRYKTLQELDDWIQSVFNVVGPVPVVYAVNKVDLRGQPGTYGDKEIEVHAKAFGAPFLYTSAKTGENVEKAFGLIAQAILTRDAGD